MSYIYCFTNLINNKKYIGSTIQNPNIRFNQHIYNATHENAHQYNYPLYSAMRKYGLKNFTFEILYEENCSEETIRKIEKEYIIKYNTLSPNGYNQTLNTEHPLKDFTSYKKMSETKRDNSNCVAMVDNNYQILKIWRSISDCAEDTKLDAKKIASVCRGERKTTGNCKFVLLDKNKALKEYADEQGIDVDDLSEGDVLDNLIAQGKHSNQTFIAFTATPKNKTIEAFKIPIHIIILFLVIFNKIKEFKGKVKKLETPL